MSLCSKCKNWSDRGTFGDVCFECLQQSGVNVDKLLSFFSNQPTPAAPRPPPAPMPQSLPFPQPQSSLSSMSSRPYQTPTPNNHGYAYSHAPSTAHVMPPPHIPSSIARSAPLTPNTASQLASAPAYSEFQQMTTDKRIKPATREARDKKRKTSTNKLSTTDETTPIRHIDCGLLTLQGNKITKHTGIARILTKIDITNPRLFDDLRRQLWEYFSSELLSKGKVSALAPNAELCTHLQVGPTRIRHLDILIDLVKTSTLKKPVAIDLMYENPFDELSSSLGTESSNFPTSANTEGRVLRSTTKQPANPRLSSSNPSAWALGGLGGTVIRGDGTLSQKLASLGQPVSYSIEINPEGWTIGQRMVFHTNPVNPMPELTQRVVLLGLQQLRATSHPITLRVHDDDERNAIGQGSMRIAYPAQVKVTDEGGTEQVTEWVAKVRFRDQPANLIRHATDALMHEACGLLLQEYQKALEGCEHLSWALKSKGGKIQLVRHAVVLTGDPKRPSQIYFLEKRLNGPYVKFSSNVNFNVTLNQRGMDEQFFWLMNAFTHWSYLHSHGQSLVCDLQGVGPILTDPQIIDLDPKRWADGNNSSKGIQEFIANHHCFAVCIALGFTKPVDLCWQKEQAVPLHAAVEGSQNHASGLASARTPRLRGPSPNSDIVIQRPSKSKLPASLAHLLATAPASHLAEGNRNVGGSHAQNIQTSPERGPQKSRINDNIWIMHSAQGHSETRNSGSTLCNQ
ncbi:hypothetical protein MJO29_010538 [Puccinia striiformis f. sp. tritici]|nr:hypothetical protein MJO29_010538 [Puccinia striiformis f. sp. tritici]